MLRKKSNYVINPFTGARQNQSRQISLFSGSRRKSSFKSSNRSTYRRLNFAQKKVLTFLAIFLFLMFLIYQAGVWISKHIFESISLFVILLVAAVFLYFTVKFTKNFFLKTIFKKSDVTPEQFDAEMNNLSDAIKTMKIHFVRSEEDFEGQLYQRLDAKGFSVDRQVSINGDKRVDMIVDGRIGIELKIADRVKSVQDLIGQVTVYKDELQKLIVVILDVGEELDLEKYMLLIKNVDPQKISIIILNGKLKRIKKKQEFILMKNSEATYTN